MLTTVIEVVPAEKPELDELLKAVGEPQTSSVETRALDGETMLAAVVTLTLPTISLFKAWLVARVERQKKTSVQIGGRIYRAYSADDVIKLEKAIRAKVDPEAKEK